MNAYMLSYDATSLSNQHAQLTAFVKANRHISQWVHPFQGCYLLKSDAELDALAATFREYLVGTLHVISRIEPSTTSGILPGWMWNWLNLPEPPALSNFLQQAALTGLLHRKD